MTLTLAYEITFLMEQKGFINTFINYLFYERRCTRNEDGARLNVMLNGEALEEVDQFKYLGSVIAANGGVEADVRHRVNEGCKVLSALKGVMKNRGLGMNVKKVLYERVVVPTVMYGSESWGMKVTETETKCQKSMTGDLGWIRLGMK